MCKKIVAYTADEVLYVWTDPAKAVGYEGQLQLSQFDIKHTSFRGLNYSRGETGKLQNVWQLLYNVRYAERKKPFSLILSFSSVKKVAYSSV